MRKIRSKKAAAQEAPLMIYVVLSAALFLWGFFLTDNLMNQDIFYLFDSYKADELEHNIFAARLMNNCLAFDGKYEGWYYTRAGIINTSKIDNNYLANCMGEKPLSVSFDDQGQSTINAQVGTITNLKSSYYIVESISSGGDTSLGILEVII